MKNEQQWRPTNVVYDHAISKWVPNYEYIAPWSHHVTSLESNSYIPILEQVSSGDLLDVGAGTAPYYQVYRDRVDSVTTVDWGESPHDISYIDVLYDLNQGLPFEANSFDTVLMADVLEHISNPKVLVGDAARVLRENGHLIIFVPFLYGLHEEPHDFYRYTRYSLLDLIRSSGLSAESIAPYGGGPDVLIDIMEKMTYRNKLARRVYKIASKAITSAVSYSSLREEYKERFPIGYTVVAKKTLSNTTDGETDK